MDKEAQIRGSQVELKNTMRRFSLLVVMLALMCAAQTGLADADLRFDSNGKVEVRTPDTQHWTELKLEVAFKDLSTVLSQDEQQLIESEELFQLSQTQKGELRSKIENSSAPSEVIDLMTSCLQLSADFGLVIYKLKHLTQLLVPHFRFYSDGRAEMLEGLPPSWKEFSHTVDAEGSLPIDLREEFVRIYPPGSPARPSIAPIPQDIQLSARGQTESKIMRVEACSPRATAPLFDSKTVDGISAKEYLELNEAVVDVDERKFGKRWITLTRAGQLDKIFGTLQITTPKDQLIKLAKQYGVIVNRPPGKDTLLIGCGNVPCFSESVGDVNFIDDYGDERDEYRKNHAHPEADTLDPDFARNPTIVGHFGIGQFSEIFGNHKYKTIRIEGIKVLTVADESQQAANIRQLLLLLHDEGVVIDNCGQYTKHQLQAQLQDEVSDQQSSP